MSKAYLLSCTFFFMIPLLLFWVGWRLQPLPQHSTCRHTTVVGLSLKNMARRNAMARRLLVLACIFLAVIQLTSVYGQETSNDGMVENADDDDADIDVYAAADDLADAGVAEVRRESRLCVMTCVFSSDRCCVALCGCYASVLGLRRCCFG